jgi:hypothetical protein
LSAAGRTLAHQPLAGAPRDLAQPHLLQPALAPQRRKEVVQLGPPDGDHQEGPIGGDAQRAVDQLHRRQIAPLQIVEHDDQRLRRGLGEDEVLEGAPHVVAHQHRIAARRPQLHAGIAGGGDADHLAEELGHPLRLLGGQVAGHPRAQLGGAHGGRLTVEQRGGLAQRGDDEAEGRTGAHRIAARHPHLDGRVGRAGARAQLVEELTPETRLADAGGTGEQHHARHRLGDALLVQRHQRRQLALAADEGCRLAQQGPGGLGLRPLAAQRQAERVAADVEARVEQTGGDLVETHRHGAALGRLAVGAQQRRRGVDDLAERQPRAQHRAAGGHRHRGVGHHLAHVQRAAGSAHRQIAGPARRHQHGRDRAVEQRLDPRAGALGDVPQVAHHRVLLEIEPGRRRGGGRLRLAARPAADGDLLGGVDPPGQRRGRQHHRDQPPLRRAERGGRRGARRRGAGHGELDALQRRDHRRAVGRPRRRVLRQHRGDQPLERARHLGPLLADGRHLGEDHARHDREDVAGGEERPSEEALAEDTTEGEDVGRRGHRAIAARLLGRHVSRRPDHVAGLREVGERAPGVHHAEVHQLDPLDGTALEEQVGGLDVAVDQTAGVKLGERAGDLLGEGERLGDGERLARQPLRQILALEPLHDQVALPVGEVAVRDVRHHAGVVDLGEDLGLAREALADVVGARREDLERDGSAAHPVVGAEHRPHAAAAGLTLDVEAVGDHGAGSQHGRSILAPSCPRGTLMKTTFQTCLAIAGLVAGGPARADDIIVDTAAELQAAMAPANAGRTIHVVAGDYSITQALFVPDGATLEGEGEMHLGASGVPAGFKRGETRIRATESVDGDVVTLGHGSTIRGLYVEDLAGRFGNVVMVTSREPDDVVAAEIVDCVLDNPNESGVGPNGPVGRGLVVLARNPQFPDEPPHEGSVLDVRMTRSIIESGVGGSGVFAINFAAESSISIDLERNVIEGGLDMNGGVSRPDAVHDSVNTIRSHKNLYRGPGGVAFGITGGSGPPVTRFGPIGSTERNTLRMTSEDDRIEDLPVGVAATGAIRFFDLPDQGPNSNNRVELTMIATKMESIYYDLDIWAGIVLAENTSVGDGNVVRVKMQDVKGGAGFLDSFWGIVWSPFEPDSPTPQGTGNRVEIVGTPACFQSSNTGLTPPPPEWFIGGDGGCD